MPGLEPALLWLQSTALADGVGGRMYPLVSAAHILAIAFVTSGSVMLMLVPLAALAAVITPALQGIMSKAVSADSQGELQGALVSISSVAMIFSPMIMTGTFAAFTGPEAPVYLPGAPFILSAALVALGLVVFLKATSKPAAA